MQKPNKYYTSGKLIISGPVIELVLKYGSKADQPSPPLDESPEEKRGRAVARARKNLRRKINANAGQWYDFANKKFYMPLFLTLTFAENLIDIPEANRRFHRFIMRFNYTLFRSRKAVLKYAVVIEFQKRGAVHYHALLFNVPFIPKLQEAIGEIWTHGFVKLNSIDNVDNIGAYVVKYMTKENDDPRLKGKKSYFCSKHLVAPLIITDDMQIRDIMELVEGEPDEVNFPFVDYFLYKDRNSIVRRLPIIHQLKREPEADTLLP